MRSTLAFNMERKQRKIIHIDMDAFFASVEQRDHPAWRGRPVIVGGRPDSRGVVAACSYEARDFGIHSAMPCSQAYRLCPDALFVPPRFEVYRAVSRQIRDIFWRYACSVEPLSLDEAYLDVTYTASCNGSATCMAREIRRQIREETGLTASAGVSYNKFLAKIASDMDKPDGLYVITPQDGPAFVESLPVGRFYGVGPATEKKMHRLGIRTGADMKAWSLADLRRHFGKAAAYYYDVARGVDERPVRSRRARKSLGRETTFEKRDVLDVDVLLDVLYGLAEQVCERLREMGLRGRRLTIKVRYADFSQLTRSHTSAHALDGIDDMRPLIARLLAATDAGRIPVRLVGISIGAFESPESGTDAQLGLPLAGTEGEGQA